MMQASVEKEIGIVGEGDVLGIFPMRSLEYLHLHNGWRIDGATISRG